MPQFVQSAFLAGLAALAIPIAIHLFFRLRTKKVELGTIRFLKIVLEENARRRKVMRWLLLSLRLACIALLVGLFARPYFSQAAVTADKELVVLLIDRSATMGLKGDQGRLLDQAISDAQAVLQGVGEKTRVEAAFFDHAVAPLRADDNLDGAQALQTLLAKPAPAALWGATSYGAAIAWARDILVSAPPGPRQLHLFTDLQRSGLDWTQVEPMPQGVSVHLHNYSRPVINNAAVTEVRPARSWIRPGESTTVTATILHGATFPLENAPVVLEIGRLPDRALDDATPLSARRVDFARLSGRISQRERVKLEPGASITVEFVLPELAEGTWQGRILIEYDDDLAFDNQQYFAISATPAYEVLVVSGEVKEHPLISETHFLEAALRLAAAGETYPQSPFAPELCRYREAGTLPPLSRFHAIVLADVADLSPTDAERLAAYVRSGGALLAFAGDRTSEASLASLTAAGLAAGTFGAIESTRDLAWRISQWDRKHPVFQPFNDPQHGDLRKLVFAATAHFKPSEDATTLASLDQGNPLIVEREVGQGRVLWVTVSCGRDWSDWSRTPMFLPLMHQLLGYEVGLTDGGRVREEALAGVTALDLATTAGERDGEAAPATPAETANANDSADQRRVERSPGVDRFARYTLVTNPSGRESETESCAPRDFEERFGLTFVDRGAESSLTSANIADERQDEVWHWLACAVLGVLLLEGFVGNRTTA